MEFSEITKQIAQVAANYDFKQPPDLLVKLQEFIASALRFLHDLLATWRLEIPALTDSRMAGNVLQIALSIAGIICVILFIFALWNQMKQLNRQSELARKGQTIIDDTLNSAGWFSQAESLAAQEKWREACRAIYLSALRLLDENAILEYSTTRTNYEYFYALAKSPQIAKTFRALASCTELIWFGKKSATSKDFEEANSYLKSIDDECKKRAATENQSSTASGAA